MGFSTEVFRGRIVVLAWVAVFLLMGSADTRAQGDKSQLAGRKFEVGAQFAFFRDSSPKSRDFTLYPYLFEESSRNNPGFGGRVGYNFSRHFTAEAEVNFLPRETIQQSVLILGIADPSAPASVQTSLLPTNTGRKVEAVFGLKAGARMGRIGLFGKARPGLMYFSEVWSGGQDTNFAMDLGGVIEYYPSRRTMIRADLSDLMVHFDERRTGAGTYSFADLPSGGVTFYFPSRVLRRSQTTHNFRLGVGFGFRF